MSVLRRPPRALMPLLAVVLCLVSAFALFAQSDETVPVVTSETVVISSENTAAAEQTASENVTDNKSVADTEQADAIPASSEATVEAKENVAEPADANKAISVEVSPADEVTTPSNTPEVVLPETIPASNKDAAATEAAPAETVVTEPAPAEAKTTETVTEPAPAPVEDVVVEVPAEAKPIAQPLEVVEATLATVEAKPAEAEPKEVKKEKELYYFESSRGSTLAVIIVLLAFVSYYTFQAQRGKEMFIRRISGLSAIEDAVGRATEMGRGVLYAPGIADMDDIQTIAGVTIMGHVARKTAEYDTDFYAPQCRSFVMSVAHEVVKQAYLEKGRIDAYRPDRINYLTDDQFGYVAGVGGIMMRDKPAACFYLGTFYAESLILAETGNAVGAIQIAGTAEPSQIPFFVAACDYTLIGEELFAASAYLSKNPREVGSLKGQDMVKVVIIAAIIIGTLLETIAATDYGQNSKFATMATTFMEYLK